MPDSSENGACSNDVLWRELRGTLVRFVRSRVPSKAVAEDIAHEALLKILKSIDSVRDNQRLGAWAYQIARNAIADYYRQKNGNEEAVDEQLEPNGKYLNDNYNDEVTRWLPGFLSELPDEERWLLEQIELRGVSQRKLSRESGLPYSTVKSRVQRARASLRALIEACCRLEFDSRGNVVGVESRHCATCAD